MTPLTEDEAAAFVAQIDAIVGRASPLIRAVCAVFKAHNASPFEAELAMLILLAGINDRRGTSRVETWNGLYKALFINAPPFDRREVDA